MFPKSEHKQPVDLLAYLRVITPYYLALRWYGQKSEQPKVDLGPYD